MNARNNNNINNNSNSKKRRSAIELRIHWDFLPPGDAHNRCDAAAAHWKRPQKQLIRNYCVLKTIGHLAFACSSMKNCYLIEAECWKFSDALECLIEESWMQKSFHFDYGVPFEDWKHCGHQGKCKSCKHKCCKNGPRKLPCVKITVEDRNHKYVLLLYFALSWISSHSVSVSEHVLWLDEPKSNDEQDSLDEDEFWSSPSRRRYHQVTGARISQLSQLDKNIYDYDAVSDDDEVDVGYDDDYFEF